MKFTCNQMCPNAKHFSCTRPLFHDGDHIKYNAKGFAVYQWPDKPIIPMSKEYMKEFYGD